MIRSRLRQLDRSVRPAWIVVVVCLVVQVTYLAEGHKDPTIENPIIDAGVYHEAAAHFAAGEPAGGGFDDAFWQPPLFPLLLGCLYGLVGSNPLIARMALAVVGTLSCLLVWWIGSRVFSRQVGLIAGLMCACHGPFIFFNTRLLPTGLAVFLDLLALALWLRCIERPRWHGWLLFGLAVGAATITVPNAIVLLVLPFIAVPRILSRHEREVADREPTDCNPWATGLRLGLAFLGTAIPIGSVTLRNYLVSHEWVLISTNGGINFYIGNNPNSDQTLAIRPGEQWRRLARESYSAGARTRAEQSAYFFRQGLKYAADQPISFLRGLGRKAIRLINACEIPRNVDAYVYRDFSSLLSVLLWRAGPFAFPFGLLAPLAAVGVVVSLGSARVLCRESLRARLGLLAFIAAYGASVVLFFPGARYRLPLSVVMTLFSAAGAVWVWEELYHRARFGTGPSREGLWDRLSSRSSPDRLESLSYRQHPALALGARCSAAVLFAVTAVAVNAPIALPTDGVNFRAELAMCVGHVRATLGRFDEAEKHLRQALQLDPRYTAAAVKLAGVVAERGQFAEAERLLRQAVMWDEHSCEPCRLLGEFLHRRSRLTEATGAFEEALAIDPSSPEAHAGLAEVFADADRIEEAIEHYREAVRLADDPGPLLIRLADALVRKQAYAEAMEFYRRALWRVEAQPATLNRIAWLLATCPQVELRDCERAIEIAEHLCRITNYGQAVALDTLAAAYAECGRWAQAVAFARRAIDTALANDDPTMANSFRPRLKIYEARLALPRRGSTQSPTTQSPTTPPPDEP